MIYHSTKIQKKNARTDINERQLLTKLTKSKKKKEKENLFECLELRTVKLRIIKPRFKCNKF